MGAAEPTDIILCNDYSIASFGIWWDLVGSGGIWWIRLTEAQPHIKQSGWIPVQSDDHDVAVDLNHQLQSTYCIYRRG